MFPIELLGDFSLDVKSVKLLLLVSGIDLLDSSQERLWVEESVQEDDSWHLQRVFFPEIKLVKTMLQVVQP